MNKDTKKTTKNIVMLLLIMVILLIIPKEVYAKTLTFDCYDNNFSVTGAGEYDEYQLSYDLCHAKSIKDINESKWKVGTTITTPSGLSNDGWYMMRRRSCIWN